VVKRWIGNRHGEPKTLRLQLTFYPSFHLFIYSLLDPRRGFHASSITIMDTIVNHHACKASPRLRQIHKMGTATNVACTTDSKPYVRVNAFRHTSSLDTSLCYVPGVMKIRESELAETQLSIRCVLANPEALKEPGL